MAAIVNGLSKPRKSHTTHPLDPLSVAEMAQASHTVRVYALQSHFGIKSFRYQTISLHEPSKDLILEALGIPKQPLAFGQSPLKPSDTVRIPRQAYFALIDPLSGNAYDGVVTLGDAPKVDSFTNLPDSVQPSISIAELVDAELTVKSHPTIQKLCADIGLSMEKVYCDGWTIGFDERWPKTQRVQQCLIFGRPHGPDSNLYAHPLDFLPVLDVNSKKLIRIDWVRPRLPSVKASLSTVPTPLTASEEPPEGWKRLGYPDTLCEYLPEYLEKENFKYRQDVKPIYITQPEGVSFTLDGNRLHWQKFDMHIGFNYREGLVINTVTYTDTDVGQGNAPTVRPLFYKLSIAEMVVPYGDPSFPHHRKMAFDVGEYGLGMMANSLTLGCDCKGSIAYLDAVLPAIDGSGEGMVLKNAICIHEEDAGLSWKHTDYRTGRAHAVRMRKLVVSCVCTLANYEYGFYFNFFQDGSVQHEIKLSGVLNTAYLAEGESAGPFGTQVSPRVNAHYHQHIFCLRVDPMVDGVHNSVVQTDLKVLEQKRGDEANYLGNGWTTEKTVFKTATSADWDMSVGRYWSIINPKREHYSSGLPVGYKIVCKDFFPLLATPDSVVARRATFASHHLWVVPYSDDKRYPAGQHVPQTTEARDGIDSWVAKGGNVEEKDVVVYVTFTANHVPRPEDFPVMPVDVVSVHLKPNNFFKRNPALDVPAEKDERSVHATPYTEGVTAAATSGETCCE